MILSHRRQFLKASIFSCAALCLPHIAGATPQAQVYSETRLLMGTLVNLKATHTQEDFVYESFNKAFAEMARVEALLTRHKSSALSLLNTQQKLIDAPKELIHVAKEAQRIEQLSQGAFNPSVLPVLEYLETHRNTSKSEIKELFSLVQRNTISVENSSVLLKQNDIRITLDGIAKGYIVDKAVQILEASGLQDFLVNAGGDVRAKGMKNPSLLNPEPWRVAVEDPNKANKYPAVLTLYNRALATSGSYEKTFSEDLHHIIMPQASTLISSPMRSVSVLAPTAMEADALSTALSCMPLKNALDFVNAKPSLSCFIITHDDTIYRSKNWA